MLNTENKLELIEAGLTRVADTLGDISPQVMRAFYSRYPDAREMFERLSLGHPEEMEGEMVSQTLYCLMAVLEHPQSTGIMLREEVVQHKYYEIPIEYFNGFIDSTVDVIVDALGDDDDESVPALNEVRETLKALAAGRYAQPVLA